MTRHRNYEERERGDEFHLYETQRTPFPTHYIGNRVKLHRECFVSSTHIGKREKLR